MNVSFSSSDRTFMTQALGLARRGLYTTDPNPRVGCVLTRGDEVVGQSLKAFPAIALQFPAGGLIVK